MGVRNVTVNVCQLFSGKTQSLLMDVVLGNLKKCSNILHACPFMVSYQASIKLQ